MAGTIEGKLDARGLRVALVLGRFNDLLGEKLLSGALDCLRRHGATEEDLCVVRVPGVWEVAQAVRKLPASGRFDAAVALGVVIRGATPHFDALVHSAHRDLLEASRETGFPVGLGIVTADDLAQAIERCGTKHGNKGWDAALAALEMANLYRALGSG